MPPKNIIVNTGLITEVKSVIAIPEEFPFYTSENLEGTEPSRFLFTLVNNFHDT